MDLPVLQLATVLAASATLLVFAGLSLIAQAASSRRQQIGRRVATLSAERPKAVASTARPLNQQDGDDAGALADMASDERAEWLRVSKRLGLKQEWAWAGLAIARGALALSVAAALVAVGGNYLSAVPWWLRTPLFGLLGLLLGAWFPVVAMRISASHRVQRVEAGLPDAIELLVVSVEAGMALESAIDMVAGELQLSQPELAAELKMVAADLKLLPDQRDALMKFAERIDRPSVRAVMTTLAQTMRYGTPLAQALRVTSTELRNDALLHLEERANRLPVLLTVPMVVFLIPAIFLMVGGPAILRLLDVLRH
ncbi:MAG TPA: type II secretion system F family protein [Reyranella sp.]|nr:type II secretion system F family protein [Reyranella sp.]